MAFVVEGRDDVELDLTGGKVIFYVVIYGSFHGSFFDQNILFEKKMPNFDWFLHKYKKMT